MSHDDEPIRALVELDHLERQLVRVERENHVLAGELEARRHAARPRKVPVLRNPWAWATAFIYSGMALMSWDSPERLLVNFSAGAYFLLSSLIDLRYRARPGEALAIPGRKGTSILLAGEAGNAGDAVHVEVVSPGPRPLARVFCHANRVWELRAVAEAPADRELLARFVARLAGMPDARWQTLVTDLLLEAIEAAWNAQPDASPERVAQEARDAVASPLAALGLRLETLAIIPSAEEQAHGVP